jgi:hypothetical protein
VIATRSRLLYVCLLLWPAVQLRLIPALCQCRSTDERLRAILGNDSKQLAEKPLSNRFDELLASHKSALHLLRDLQQNFLLVRGAVLQAQKDISGVQQSLSSTRFVAAGGFAVSCSLMFGLPAFRKALYGSQLKNSILEREVFNPTVRLIAGRRALNSVCLLAVD